MNVITRRGSNTEYVCVTYSCFTEQHQPAKIDLDLTSEDTEIIFEGVLNTHEARSFEKNEDVINGVLSTFRYQSNPTANEQHTQMVRIRRRSESIRGSSARLFLLPGGVVILKTTLLERDTDTIQTVERMINDLSASDSTLQQAVKTLDLNDLNQILFSCNVEEKANRGDGFGVYDLPNYGRFPYAGFAGLYQEWY